MFFLSVSSVEVGMLSKSLSTKLCKIEDDVMQSFGELTETMGRKNLEILYAPLEQNTAITRISSCNSDETVTASHKPHQKKVRNHWVFLLQSEISSLE